MKLSGFPRALAIRGVASMVSLSLPLTSACHGKKSSQGSQAPAVASAPIVPIQGATVPAKSDQNGILTATVDPASKSTQVVQASAASPIKAAKAAFPVGSLGIVTDISLQAGASLANDTTRSELGLAKSVVLTAAGTAVVVSSSTGLDAAQPFTLAIPVDPAALALAGPTYAVIYRAFSAGKLVVGLIPSGELQVGGGLVQFTTKLFGSYQAVTAPGLPTTDQQAASSTPIASASGQTVAATGPLPLPGTFAISAPPVLGNLAMPDIKWSASINAATYDLIISTTTACPTSVQTQTGIKANDFVPSALADGTYFVCMKARNATGDTAPSNDSYTFTIKTTPPGTFAITAPTTPTKNPTPTVAWGASAGAVNYDLAISAAANCSSPTQSYPGIAATSQALTNLADGTYYACVTARDGAGNTAKVASPFVIKTTPPGAFTINGPTKGTASTTPTVAWTASNTASSYTVTLATDAACTQNTTVSNVTSTSMTVSTPLAAQQLYFVCVTATDAAGNSTVASNNAYSFFVGTLEQGQPDLVTNQEVKQGFYNLQGLSSDGTRFFVADTNNHRVLIWNSLPTSPQQIPDVVLGQPDKSSNSTNNGGLSAKSMGSVKAVFSDGTHLAVADNSNNRVLIWNSVATVTTGQAADLVLGQPDMTHGLANAGGSVGANTLYQPQDLTITGTKLLVVDQGNGRVLIWNTFPTGNQAPATHVIGQTSLTAATGGCMSNTFQNPVAIGTDGTNLVISDGTAGNAGRALIYTAIPTSDGVSANYVIGQSGLGACTNPGSVGPTTLQNPLGVAIRGGNLYVADKGANRVLVFAPIPTANNASATYVLGQSSNTSSSTSNSQAGLSAPAGLGSDATNLYVADNNNNRVMVWPLSSITANGVNAASEIGQAAFGSSGKNSFPGNPTAQTLFSPTGGASDGTHLLVVDQQAGRVLIWNTIPTASNVAADTVLGRGNLTTGGGGGTTQTSFAGATAACTDGSHIAVTDMSANRVLIWNSYPAMNGQGADLVLGQSTFTNSSPNAGGPATANTLNAPVAIDCTGGRLIVGDSGNNRVLIWNSFPTSTQQAADVVVGQTSMGTTAPGTNNTGLSAPYGVVNDGTRLLVADSGNNRVLVWNAVPATNGVAASFALGQPDLVTTSLVAASSTSLSAPKGVTLKNGRVFVADTGNNRVLSWNAVTLPASNTSSGIAADAVFGQPTFSGSTSNAGGVSATSLNAPYFIFSDAGWVYVPEAGGNRLLMVPL